MTRGQSQLASLGLRVSRAHRSRRGAAALLFAIGMTAASVQSWSDLPLVPVTFAASLLAGWALATVASRAWEASTWPQSEKFAARSTSASTQPMLRVDANGKVFTDHGGFLFARRHFFTATGLRPVQIATPAYRLLAERQRRQPVFVAKNSVRTWWWYQDKFYWDSHGYSATDVLALLKDRERRHERKLERAHLALRLEHEPTSRRSPIPRELRKAVFERDGGRCVECGGNFDIQYDHILPVALGGATTLENLQILCAGCNCEKSDHL